MPSHASHCSHRSIEALVGQQAAPPCMRTTIIFRALTAAALVEPRAAGAKFNCACLEEPVVVFVVAFFAVVD